MYSLQKNWDQYLNLWLDSLDAFLDLVKKSPLFLRELGDSMERHLEAKRMTDLLMDQTWRWWRLPPLNEIIRVHERLNLLQSRLEGLREKGRTREAPVLSIEQDRTGVPRLLKNVQVSDRVA